MPDRYVREALLRSDAWDALPDAKTQLLFVRLILIADDFGCYDGRPEVIANNVYPTTGLTEADRDELVRSLDALYQAGMLVRYSNAGKPYIAIWQWGNDLRGNRKFPAPPIDVDVEGLKVRGKFGKEIGWTNPAGCDAVSVLLDAHGRAVVPQPPEWRPLDHLRPNPKSRVGWRREAATNAPAVTGSTTPPGQLQAASDTPPVTSSLSQHAVTGTPDSRVETTERQSPASASPEEQNASDTPRVSAASTTPTNGDVIEFKDGGFVGLTEAQRLKWQSMFDSLSIPDQVDRAAAWLAVHHEERDAIQSQGLGFAQFLVRWLLREVRSPRTGHAS